MIYVLLILKAVLVIGVEDFCSIRKKCVHCCPFSPILDGDRHSVNGTERWKRDAETCFRCWGKVGIDRNVYMRMQVCPGAMCVFPHRVVIDLVVRTRIG